MGKEIASKPKFREIIEARAPGLTHSQQDNIRNYHRRVAFGTIFGSRTHEVLPPIGEVNDAIEGYFNTVESGFQNLNKEYGLGNLYGEKFAPMQEEATRLMWIYGISPALFTDHQRGLLLLGVAATLVDLEGKEKEVRIHEKKRMHHAVRMLSQEYPGTMSTKVDKLVREFSQKTSDHRDSGKIDLSEVTLAKAIKEVQYTTPPEDLPIEDQKFINAFDETGSKWREEALANVDEEKSSLLHSQGPHIQRIKEDLAITEDPESKWIATTLDHAEFVRRFGNAAAFRLGNLLVFPNNIDSYSSLNNQQHEYLHTLIQPTGAPYLGRGLPGEADVESNTDVPLGYPHQRLLRYFVDDIINYCTAQPVGDTATARIRVKGSNERSKGILNSHAEIAWNKTLIDIFGLEGYLTYYLVRAEDTSIDEQVASQLLDTQQGASRFVALADRRDKSADLPEDFYEKVYTPLETMNNILYVWNQSTGVAIWETLGDSPHKVSEQLSYEQVVELSGRLDAFIFCGEPRDFDLTDRIKSLKKIAWLKKGFPLVMDSFYDYNGNTSEEVVEDYLTKGRLLRFSDTVPLLGRDCVTFIPTETPLDQGKPLPLQALYGDYQDEWFRTNAHASLDTFTTESSTAVYLSFIHTLSQAIQQDTSFFFENIDFGRKRKSRLALDTRTPLSLVRKEYAEAVLLAHNQLYEAEDGNIPRIIERIKAEILTPLAAPVEENVIKYHDPLSVYQAVTKGQKYFDFASREPTILTTDEIYNMIESVRLIHGCASGVPQIPEQEHRIHAPIIEIDLHNDQAVAVHDDKNKPETYHFRDGNPQVLRQNLLLFIYGYLEKQIREFDMTVKSRKNQHDSKEGFYYFSEPLTKRIAEGSAHVGVFNLYRNYNMTIDSRIRAEQDIEEELMLTILEQHSYFDNNKPFDLSQIPDIQEDMDRLVVALREQMEEEEVIRLKRVITAGCKLPGNSSMDERKKVL